MYTNKNNKDIQLGKLLSWILRHGALNEGLPISTEGFIPVDKILQHRSFKGKYSKANIEKVVSLDSKQRFKLRTNPDTNTLEIKANQGHSITEISDDHLTPILQSKYSTVVHGTFLKHWAKIKIEGLHHMQRQHIHFAKEVAGDCMVISGLRTNTEIYIYIDQQKAIDDGIKFYESDNGVILTRGDINGYLKPKYFLKVVKVSTAITAVSQRSEMQEHPIIEGSSAVRPQAQAMDHSKPAAQIIAPTAKPRKPRHRNKLLANSKWEVNMNGAETVNFSVVVTGFPEFTQPQDLAQVLKQFGTVKVNSVKDGVAQLSFASTLEAQRAVQESNKVAIYGEVLTIKPLTMKELKKAQAPVKNEFVRSKQKSVIIQPMKINLNGDFHSQLDSIMSAVRLTQEQVMGLSQLYTHLQETLQVLWPGCKAVPFGSIPTGLGIKTSDADCFILVPPAYRHQNSVFVTKAKRLLQQHPHIFTEILAIPRANTPIVKFFHVPTETNCDVSFKTPLGARNSELIAFLLHADRRLIPMSVLIKYWAKVHDLSGTGKLTNYALTMLVIFYLQQPPISILPSVQWLQSDSANDEFVDHWNTGFMRDHSRLPPNTNTSSISELIGGFFQYYSTFNFNDLMICPYLGIPLKKNVFKDVRQLPPDFERYKHNVLNLLVHPIRFLTSICVQDPFEQCHNVASPISSNLGEKIKAYFQFAANAYEVDKLNGCQNFLKKILLEKPKFQEKKPIPEYRVKLYPKMLIPIVNPDWKSVVREAIFTLFESIYKLKLEKIEIEESKKPIDTKREKEMFKTKLTKPIWSRKRFSRLYDFVKLEFAKKQSRITEEIIQSVKHTINVDIQVSIAFYQTKTAVVTVKFLDGDVENYRDFGRFYLSVMQNWCREILKPHLSKTSEAVTATPSLNSEDSVQNEQNEEEEESGNETEENQGQSDDYLSCDEDQNTINNNEECNTLTSTALET